MRVRIFSAALLLLSISALADGLADLKTYGQFYVGSAPNEATIQEFKEKQGGVIIDLRTLKESDCGARASATKSGVKYQSVPFDKNKRISSKTVQQVEALIIQAGDKPVMMVCSTGNRAAGLLAIHLAQTENLTPNEAISKAEALGLTSKDLAGKVRRYLTRKKTPAKP